MNKIELHADDLGRSKEVNESIFDSIDKGIVSGVSIIMGNKYSQEAIKGALKRNVRISLHLNLTEEVGISKNSNLAFTNEKKKNSKSFLDLLVCRYKKNFYKTREEIEKEIEKQIVEFKKISQLREISVDGHKHIHCIPWISDILIKFAQQYKITWMRLPKEKFTFPSIKNFINRWYYINLIKFFVLRILSMKLKKKLIKNNIKFSSNFIGILETGYMQFTSINSGLKKIFGNKNFGNVEHVEVLIHPGSSSFKEENYWSNKKDHAYYLDENRKSELTLSKNKKLINLINSYENFDNR